MKAAWITLLIATLLLTACAGVPSRPEPPRVNLAGMTMQEASLFEQRFGLKLRLQNPNDFDLPITALTYELDINDKRFASGVTNRAVTVPRFASELLEVEAYSDISGVLRQLTDLGKSGAGALRYRLKGVVIVGSSGQQLPFSPSSGYRLPFEASGELDLSKLDKK